MFCSQYLCVLFCQDCGSTKTAGALPFLFQCLKQLLIHFPSSPSFVLWCQGLNVISLNSETDVREARRSRRNSSGCNKHEPNMPRILGPWCSSKIGRAWSHEGLPRVVLRGLRRDDSLRKTEKDYASQQVLEGHGIWEHGPFGWMISRQDVGREEPTGYVRTYPSGNIGAAGAIEPTTVKICWSHCYRQES